MLLDNLSINPLIKGLLTLSEVVIRDELHFILCPRAGVACRDQEMDGEGGHWGTFSPSNPSGSMVVPGDVKSAQSGKGEVGGPKASS